MLTENQYHKLSTQLEQTANLDDHETTGTHQELIMVLNQFGYYPTSREYAYQLAGMLLDEYSLSLADKGE